jgi:maleate isomerase
VSSGEVWQQRVGVIIPLDPDETIERSQAELSKLAPSNVIIDVGFQQVPVAEDGTQLPIDATFVRVVGADPQLEALAKELASRGAAAVGYACTSASFVDGPKWAEGQARRIAAACGVPATNTSLSVVEALRALGVNRIAVATPYIKALNDRLVSFLAHHRVEVLSLQGLGLTTNHSTTPTERIVGAAVQAAVPGVEAVLIACTGQKVADQIESLEARLGIPVVAANQATLWHTARIAGCGGGRAPGRLYEVTGG